MKTPGRELIMKIDIKADLLLKTIFIIKSFFLLDYVKGSERKPVQTFTNKYVES